MNEIKTRLNTAQTYDSVEYGRAIKDIEKKLGMSIPMAQAHLGSVTILVNFVKDCTVKDEPELRRKAIASIECWDRSRMIFKKGL